MNFEIEIKAWVDDPEVFSARLDQIAVFQRNYEKSDRYYRFGDGRPDVRLRTDNGSHFLTWKEKKIENGVEFNRENETGVETPDVVEALLLRLGATVLVEKHKKGSAWALGQALVEFSRITGLGHFVEIEICLEPQAQETEKQKAAEIIYTILDDLCVPRNRIEVRPYTQMLVESLRKS